MAKDTSSEQDLPKNLGDGLVMRRATLEDRERVADFHANTLLDIGQKGPDEPMRRWMLDMMSGEHPTLRATDFIIVEDTTTGKVVSSMCLISQTWTYDGIPFKFGQPEIVSTDPAYRRRGLVRAQFNEIHRWSAERGELVQGITGIPWYYRQFGYEMAVNLGGSRQGYRPNVPRLKEGEQEPYNVRKATTDDIPLIMDMYRQAASRSLIASVRDEAIWRYDLEKRTRESGFSIELRIIETLEGKPVGVLAHSWRLWGPSLNTHLYETIPGMPLLATTPTVLRYLDATGVEYAKRPSTEDEPKDFGIISFGLGAQHPVYDTIPNRLPRVNKPYAWYIRVLDLPAFVNRIAPALEKRLAESAQAGYAGELKINLFRTGLLLKFQEGSLSVEAWKPDRVEEGDAAFPDLIFLQLLFGYRSLEELRYAFPDCSANTDTGRALMPILFPRKDSHVWAGG